MPFYFYSAHTGKILFLKSKISETFSSSAGWASYSSPLIFTIEKPAAWFKTFAWAPSEVIGYSWRGVLSLLGKVFRRRDAGSSQHSAAWQIKGQLLRWVWYKPWGLRAIVNKEGFAGISWSNVSATAFRIILRHRTKFCIPGHWWERRVRKCFGSALLLTCSS